MPDIDNPLPDVLRVKVDNMKNIDPIMTDVKKLPDIQDTGYAKDLAQKVEVVNKISHTITLVVMIVSSLLTITIINNTIQLVIQSRKKKLRLCALWVLAIGILNVRLYFRVQYMAFGCLACCYTNQYCPKIFSSNACAFFYSGVWLCTGACSIIRNSYGCDIFSRRKLDEYQKALAGLDLCQIIQMI